MRTPATYKKSIILLLTFLQVILLSSTCFSLGITPTKATYEYQKGATKNFQFKVISSGIEKTTDYNVQPVTFPEHGFADKAREDKRLLIPNVEISERNLTLAPHRRYPINVSFTMPEFETPGKHGFFIKITEKIERTRNTGIVARPAVLFKTTINVPYPGKYIDLEFDAPNTELGKKVFLTLKGWNRGKQKISSAKGEIKIYSGEELITTLKTNEKTNIDPEGTKFELWADWKPSEDVKAGVYQAKATVNYDGKTKNVSGEILLGGKNVQIVNHSKKFTSNEVNKFFVEVQSLWNGKIKNVFAKFSLEKENGAGLAVGTTPSITLHEWDKQETTSFLDLSGVQPGSYQGIIKLNYGDNGTAEKQFDVEVVKKEKEKEPEKEKPEEIEEKESSINLTYLIIGILVALLIIGQIVFFVFIKRQKDDDDEEDF